MKHLNKYLLYVGIIVLIIPTINYIYVISKNQKTGNNVMIEKAKAENSLDKSELLMLSVLKHSINIDPNLPSLSLNLLGTNKTVNISDLIDNENLFLFFSFNDCQPCYELELERYSKLMKLTNGKFPIVIAMECNPRQLLNMCDKYNLDKNNFYYLSSDQISKISFETPCYIEVNTNNVILSKYFPDKLLPELSVNYLQYVYRKKLQ